MAPTLLLGATKLTVKPNVPGITGLVCQAIPDKTRPDVGLNHPPFAGRELRDHEPQTI